ncbi:hypothetical protein [uncultured Chitinophaga sp.]|uniref:hypothetical protein n=1 Tax=uncultured Chitinophaga sp. TaxID=339340 RepID=UPI0025E41293|nr:hypothetical protein [uncultured Chitinophaga sp.]
MATIVLALIFRKQLKTADGTAAGMCVIMLPLMKLLIYPTAAPFKIWIAELDLEGKKRWWWILNNRHASAI